MSLYRRAAKRDAVEKDIFAAFRAAGCSILPISAAGYIYAAHKPTEAVRIYTGLVNV